MSYLNHPENVPNQHAGLDSGPEQPHAAIFSAPQEQELAQRIATELRVRGFLTWTVGNILPGDDRKRVIQERIDNSDFAIDVLSSDFLDGQGDLLRNTLGREKPTVFVRGRAIDEQNLEDYYGISRESLVPSRPWYRSPEKDKDIIMIAGEVVKALGGTAIKPALMQPQERYGVGATSRGMAERQGRREQKQPGSQARQDREREANLEARERAVTSREAVAYQCEQRLHTQASALDMRAVQLHAKEQALNERERRLVHRERGLENGLASLNLERKRLEAERAAFRQERTAYAERLSSGQQPSLETQPNEPKQLVLSDAQRLEALATLDERYDGQKVQIHVLHASENQALVKRFMTQMSWFSLSQWAEVTASNERAGAPRGGLKTHEINPANEADRLLAADIVAILVDADAFDSEHLYKMVRLAAEKRQAYQGSGKSCAVIPILFGRTTNTFPELQELAYVPDQPIASASDKDAAIIRALQSMTLHAKDIAENRGLTRSLEILNRR